jgi:acetyl esterase/lipase
MPQSSSTESVSDGARWLATHPASNKDSLTVAGLRSAVAPFKGLFDGVAGRERYNGLMEATPAPAGVRFESAVVGGIPGWWARPAGVIYIHGGWFTWGTAASFRIVGGHIALAAGAATFLPDYRLAPEHQFPAGIRDLEACYRGLLDQGITKIAIAGDSAGGNLALVLTSIASGPTQPRKTRPVGAVVFSPITDLSLAGASYDTRAEADLYFTKDEAATLVQNYLGGSDTKHALASPLLGDLSGLPPIRVHVGDSEVLLDDSRRYVQKAVAAAVDATLDVWMEMPHGFALNVGMFDASAQALQSSGAFLAERLGRPRAQ